MTLRDLLSAGMQSLRQLFSSTEPGTNGAIAVEFAIIAPALVLMMVCTVDLGMGIYRKMQVENAAQAGAEYAIEHGYTGSIANVVSNATAFSGIVASPGPSEFCGCPSSTGVTSAACDSTCPSGASAGTYVTVSAQGTYNTLLPYPVLPNTFTFAAQSTVRIQ